MKSTFLLIGLISFTFLSCEELIERRCDYDNDNHPLVRIMNKMSENMDKMTMSKDPDYDFAMMMKEHHKGAIDMANYELEHGDDGKIKAMAQEMKEKQTIEIENLDAFMGEHKVIPDEKNGMAFMEASENAMDKMDIRVKTEYLNDDPDHDFAALMIHHHRSAVGMADAEISFGHEEHMIEMAIMMKKDQLKEIEELRAWLDKYKN